MFGIPALGGPNAANATASSGLTNEQRQDRSGVFQFGNITVATGASKVSASTSAADGIGAASGGTSAVVWAVLVVGLGAFAWILTRK